MTCPHCGEHSTLVSQVKHWVMVNVPDWLYRWNERRDADKTQALLVKHYYEGARLTPRENGVCYSLVVCGFSMETVAANMNVTRERVRQIRAKALRKLIEQNKP